MTDGGVQLSGYIDIKQPAKVKGRKLKSWKKKWVILQEMSIRSAGGRSAAKVDVYADEKTSQSSPADKHTFILEFVTEVRTAKSKTRDHAFEVVEREPVLLFSGATETESQTWVSALMKIFWPEKKKIGDCFAVAILSNEHTRRLVLHGEFLMTVSTESLSIRSEAHNSYEWSLSTLKRFHVEKDAVKPEVELLVIESGPKSESGEAVFKFTADNVGKILDSIKQNIFLAMKQKQSKSNVSPKLRSAVTSQSSTESDLRPRADTSSSVEQRFKELLENNTSGSKLLPGTMTESRQASEVMPEVDDGTPPALPKKKKSIVTFNQSLISNLKPTVDLLSTPNELAANDNDSSDYNKIELNTPNKSKPFVNIVSAFTIANTDIGTTRVLLDERGYSHVDICDRKPVVVDSEKGRSVSNVSSHSSVSFRSVSVGSRDSGIVNTGADNVNSELTEKGRHSHRSTNSFDSAVSTSSAMDQIDMSKAFVSTSSNLTVEIEEIEVTASELEASHYGEIDDEYLQKETLKGENLYADIPAGYKGSEKMIKKRNSAGNMKVSSNDYEDIKNVVRKKNLVKHLGMDPAVDPSSVAPSLPERPASNRLRRKNYSTDKKRFTLPFRIKRDKKTRDRAPSISSSSSGGSETTDKNAELTLKAWPLGNRSTIVDNEELYHPIAIQRFLTDDDGTVGSKKRERSCSLNLNSDIALKRPSVGSTNKENTVWKHNRNGSMQIDTLSYDREISMLNKTDINGGDLSLMPDLLIRNNQNDTGSGFNATSIDNSFRYDYDDEPIYAEVEPTCRSSGDISENPFPNLTTWLPHDVSDVAEVSELNETVFENQTLVVTKQGRDLFNQGFVCEEVDKESERTLVNDSLISSDNVLIDISMSDGSQHNTVAFDIFTLGIWSNMLSSQPLIPLSTNVNNNLSQSVSHNLLHVQLTESESTTAQAQGDVYMDMSACKNESIYVMPSK
ncbi:uncharacterized protein LOC127845095 isoform X2 [Dreissena polymorpha]|uniref:PH domain-containing protein n=2 Tax=Dreissena polymorpha TaxID=45954 RepID=A0A9D4EB05_DREPO|nr:uncharacterized protein LOC127845095 isoform X2 [Dreissena polymorpha]KAH3776408.1 hypothetical protein DPMN_177831 [Dreissena polymorpha]